MCLSATLALANICLHAANGPLVIAAGALGPLFKLLKSQSVEVQTQAMCVTGPLASHSRNLLALFTAGTVDALVPLLRRRSTPQVVQLYALEVLVNLTAGVAVSRAAVFAAGALPCVMDQLHSACKDCQDKAAALLANLACGWSEAPGDQVCVAAAAGAIKPLIKLIASDRDAAQMSAASALGSLAFNAGKKALLGSAGAIAPLVRLLQSQSVKVQELAARALLGLAYQGDTQARAIAAAGSIILLVQLLRSDSTGVQDQAVMVLSSLAAAGSPQDIITMLKAGALPLLVKLEGNADSEAAVQSSATYLLLL